MLYLCATPIGNLEDMTFRAIRILREVNLIAAEDTRRTRKLLTHFDIHTPLIRFDENCKSIVAEKILQRIQAGESVAVVSDAGLPAISDPGADLVRLAIDAGIKVCPIPGANAALSALICSGLDTTKFLFAGFPPKTKKNRREFLEKLSTIEATIIFYEAPHRLKNFLSELAEVFGERQAVLARELTKIHEEFLRGKISELKNIDEPRGEFVVVVESNKNFQPIEENPLEFYEKLLEQGLDKKSAMREAGNVTLHPDSALDVTKIFNSSPRQNLSEEIISFCKKLLEQGLDKKSAMRETGNVTLHPDNALDVTKIFNSSPRQNLSEEIISFCKKLLEQGLDKKSAMRETGNVTLHPDNALDVTKIFNSSPRQNLSEEIISFCKKLLEQGLDKKSAMRETAKKFNVSRREIYNTLIKEETK